MSERRLWVLETKERGKWRPTSWCGHTRSEARRMKYDMGTPHSLIRVVCYVQRPSAEEAE